MQGVFVNVFVRIQSESMNYNLIKFFDKKRKTILYRQAISYRYSVQEIIRFVINCFQWFFEKLKNFAIFISFNIILMLLKHSLLGKENKAVILPIRSRVSRLITTLPFSIDLTNWFFYRLNVVGSGKPNELINCNRYLHLIS